MYIFLPENSNTKNQRLGQKQSASEGASSASRGKAMVIKILKIRESVLKKTKPSFSLPDKRIAADISFGWCHHSPPMNLKSDHEHWVITHKEDEQKNWLCIKLMAMMLY